MHEPIDHIDLVVSDLERSLAFYTELLKPLGYTGTGDIAGERGERVVYLDNPGHRGQIGLRERQSEGRPDRYALGLHHLALTVGSRAMVDERAQWLSANGHEIESGPGEYDYSPGYYAVFFYDPDGLKLELVHRSL
jgi:catechol 2,3-dioxygenase-like lactoylglutathione lyase family enzyme